MAIDQITERLRDAGLRVTATRVSVLGVLEASDDHPRVEQIIERVRGAGMSISTQATYDVCEALHRAGLARKIEPAGGPARYESRTGDSPRSRTCVMPARRGFAVRSGRSRKSGATRSW